MAYKFFGAVKLRNIFKSLKWSYLYCVYL